MREELGSGGLRRFRTTVRANTLDAEGKQMEECKWTFAANWEEWI